MSLQKLEPGRRRRSVDNSTLELTDPVVVGRRLRVIMPEDLEDSRQSAAMLISVGTPGECATGKPNPSGNLASYTGKAKDVLTLLGDAVVL